MWRSQPIETHCLEIAKLTNQKQYHVLLNSYVISGVRQKEVRSLLELYDRT